MFQTTNQIITIVHVVSKLFNWPGLTLHDSSMMLTIHPPLDSIATRKVFPDAFPICSPIQYVHGYPSYLFLMISRLMSTCMVYGLTICLLPFI